MVSEQRRKTRSEKLIGENYREWAQSVRLALQGRGQLHHINGESPPPGSDSKALLTWKAEDALVSSWLVNSMGPTVRKYFMFMSSASEMWHAIKEAYGDGGNSSHIFDLKSRVWALKQGDLSLGEYYLAKSTLWQELDLTTEDHPCCASHTASHAKRVDNERLYELLAGLNAPFDDVRARILSQEPLPSVREAFAILRHEDSRKKVMLPQIPAPPAHPPEVSALAVRSSEPRHSKPRPVCDHCKKVGHTKDTCWDIHGKPPDWKSKKHRGRSYLAESSPDTTAAPSGDKFDKILELLTALQPSPREPTATVVNRGNFSKALATIKGMTTGTCWIVDSGASDHMSADASLFITYSPTSTPLTVKVADASKSAVAGYGSVQISSTLTLHNVLHVPKLHCNLLSVSQLAKDKGCRANFFSTHCLFQDLFTGMTIGTAKEFDGLYYLDENDLHCIGSCNKLSLPKISQLELWHK